METTEQQRLIKALLNHDYYMRAKPLILDGFFEKEGLVVFKTLCAMHEKYETDIKIGDLKEYLFATNKVTTAGRTLYNNIFDCIDMEDDPNEAIMIDLLRMQYKKNIAYSIGEIVADIANGKDRSLNEIQDILRSSEAEPCTILPSVTSDIGELLAWSDPSKQYSFGIQGFQERGVVAGPGNLVGVFARPDVGKSSFCAALAVNFANQGKSVGYFGNEEPGQKIKLNMVRSAIGISDTELVANFKKGIVEYDEWNKVKDNIVMKDVVGFSVEQLDTEIHTENYNVVFSDQIDKFGIAGNYENNTHKHKDRYVFTRELAKKYGLLMINVCQAGADAQDKRTVTYDQMDGSKTGKAGELDIAIGIGVDGGPVDTMVRAITISKNKAGSCWKGTFDVEFNPFTNRWK